jgi:hypothetical protein
MDCDGGVGGGDGRVRFWGWWSGSGGGSAKDGVLEGSVGAGL